MRHVLVAVVVVVLAAGPAVAKGAMEISAAAHTVRSGQVVRVSGAGDDDAAHYLQACVEERDGGQETWRLVSCGSPASSGAGARVDTRIMPQRRGTMQFRGVLYKMDSPDDRHPSLLRTSPVTTVRVR
ncbi:hypothetical protein AB0A70_21160 [Streptomyces morookaense]|uniref:hypothetical protein n=1 Tax=Streptomyces morookaense TaxID=1970 RepID=UPI0033CE9216